MEMENIRMDCDQIRTDSTPLYIADGYRTKIYSKQIFNAEKWDNLHWSSQRTELFY